MRTEKHRDEFPMAAETVLKSTNVDDSIDSVPNDSQGIKLYDELHQLWSKAGMPAHKRVLNSAKALERILTERRASVVHIASDGLPMVKTLGQKQCRNSKQCRNNVATPCCAKNRRCESSLVHTYTLLRLLFTGLFCRNIQ